METVLIYEGGPNLAFKKKRKLEKKKLPFSSQRFKTVSF